MGRGSYVDLLIVGAGPAGLMAAVWASQFNIGTKIIDNKASRTRTGHADGLHARTLEILNSFGIAHEFTSRATWINDICSWVRRSITDRLEYPVAEYVSRTRGRMNQEVLLVLNERRRKAEMIADSHR